MRVIELVIDGFKSYAVRTVISGWDDSFNAITGLNGSGKSNILDAICFVLGITAMGVVRAQNLQDLIYKRGQAGVTKASVTIVFDNRDKSKSPIGFEDSAQISVTRQIVLGGTSKYLINGHRAQQQTVQNLFHSVQLNINNPNFLIMQGRITKVLNMKPVEILSMIEEAAGTRMFEDRRDKALKTMAKKETKVQEIDSLLKEEIEPKLEKLRNEKRAFLDFQQTQSDLERLTRLVVAYDYVRGSEKAATSTTELERVKARGRELEDNAARMKNEISNLEEDLQKVMTTRDRELRKGGKFLKLEEQVKAYEHDLVRLATSADLKRASYDEEKGKRAALEKSKKECKTQSDAKAKALQKLQSQYESLKEKHDKKVATIDENEELLQTLQTGVASREGQESGYQGQLQNAKAQANEALTQQEQAKLKINHLTARIKEDEPRAKKAQTQNAGLLKEIETLKTHAAKLERDLQKLGYEPGKEDELSERESALEKEIQEKKQQVEALRRKVSNIDFSYSDPTPNFDRSKVKGVVAQLFTLDEKKSQAGTALEICAGGRLYNVVVDTAETGSQLLQNGKLRKRVTIIPLNKISAFKASAEKLGAAQKIAPGKVNLALDLVGYDEEVTAAIEYVFGSTLITADAEAAKKVTFDPNVRLKSVTLEGDVYDPSGTLSGGSAPTSAGVLLTMQKIHKLNQEILKLSAELDALRKQMTAEKKKTDGAKALKKDYDLKLHEITLKEQQINGNTSSEIMRAVEEMKASVEQLKADIVTAKAKHADSLKDIKRIEKDIAEFSSNKGSKLAELQKSLETMKKEVAKSSTDMKNAQNELQEARLEAEQVDGDLGGLVDQLDELSASLASQEQELQQLEAEQLKIRESTEIAKAELADERAKLSSFDEEIRSLQQASKAKSAQVTKEGLEMQTLKHQVEKLQKEQSTLAATLTHLESEHGWIADEKKAFGKPGSPYDFKQHDMVESKSSLKTITERFQGMKKKINPKVMNMIDSVEKKEVALKNMMRTVIRDKRKIEDTIATLDEYKKTALEKTWKKVDGDFGRIFADLLPGSFAKLVAPEGQTIADGLEVKVQLGKVWKASLTELSGGQRSLIALSLILSLLQFKPAPLYILDEVDAALDPSHTQNIGHLIKTRFKGSQFIIVSLKEGMFGNANRLYQIRFVDGTSVVTASRGDDAGK